MNEQALREALHVRAAEQAFDPDAVGRAVERGRARRRRRRTTLLAAVPVVALAVAGAGAAARTWLPADPPAARSAGAQAADRPARLLTQATSPGYVLHARLDGTLTVTDDGCVAITPVGSAVVPVAWPPAWSVSRDDDGRAVVHDPQGQLFAREGGPVGVGGALVNPAGEGSAIDPAHPCALGSSRVFQVGDGLIW